MKEGSAYQYTADDLQRYVEGKMSSSEMHALEKAALEDPFLADALEGIREMRPNLKEDLMEMQNKLSEETQEKPAKSKRRLIALLLLLLLFLSVGTWLMFRNDGGTGQLAKVDGTGEGAVPPVMSSDTASTSDLKGLDDKSEDAVSAGASASGKTAETEKAKSSTGSSETASATKPPAQPVTAAPASNTEVSQPTASAETKKAEEAPKTAKAAPAKAVTEAQMQADSKGTAAATMAARSKGANNFDLLEMAKNVEPAIGWPAFAKYISSNMQRPAGGLHGTVGTNFIVYPDGSISDVTVVKSLHPDYDKEAVRLLQNGPKWKVSNGEKPVKAVYNLVF